MLQDAFKVFNQIDANAKIAADLALQQNNGNNKMSKP